VAYVIFWWGSTVVFFIGCCLLWHPWPGLLSMPGDCRRVLSVRRPVGRGSLPGWAGFAEVREALLWISSESSCRQPWSDQAWAGPVVAALALLVAGVIVWLLL